jgi:hypothetical protein
LAYLIEIHIVEQQCVDAGTEGFFELHQRVDFHLDLDEMADTALRAFDRLSYAASDDNMIVLDQNCIIEAKAMVGAAPDPDSVLLD